MAAGWPLRGGRQVRGEIGEDVERRACGLNERPSGRRGPGGGLGSRGHSRRSRSPERRPAVRQATSGDGLALLNHEELRLEKHGSVVRCALKRASRLHHSPRSIALSVAEIALLLRDPGERLCESLQILPRDINTSAFSKAFRQAV